MIHLRKLKNFGNVKNVYKFIGKETNLKILSKDSQKLLKIRMVDKE